MKHLLDVQDLALSFSIQGEKTAVVQGIHFSLQEGEALGIIGESGSGKSVTVQSLLRLTPSLIDKGKAFFDGVDLLQLSTKGLQGIRGRKIGLVFQDSATALNPTMSIGAQLLEPMLFHGLATKQNARARGLDLLHLVGISDPRTRFSQYPHQLSGGMRQRVLIAIALAGEPRILIADEPTSALDPAIQIQIIELFKELRQKLKMSQIIISHDIGVISSLCERMLVMQAGRIVEQGTTQEILRFPQHPYTRLLLQSKPSLQVELTQPKKTIVEVKQLSKIFTLPRGKTCKAVREVTFSIQEGETLGLFGESGCGKSTLGRTLLRLYEPTSGQIFFQGENITQLSSRNMKRVRRHMQMIFQNPLSSLSPRMTVEQIISEPLEVHQIGDSLRRKRRVSELLNLVSLPQESKHRYPHEFSRGQQQRIGIARALALSPQWIICDEPLSALDISIQAQIADLLLTLQKQLHLTYLFISHDLQMIKVMATHVSVMMLGEFVEMGPTQSVFAKPRHPYTQSLLHRIPLSGEPPSPFSPPKGCVFCTRCPKARPLCFEQKPALLPAGPEHLVACHFTGDAS